MTPHAILAELKQQGVELKVKDGKLHGPRGMTPEQKACVSESKIGLLIALSYKCPVCDGAVRMLERPGYWVVDCPVHHSLYSEIVNKTLGKSMGLVKTEEAGRLF